MYLFAQEAAWFDFISNRENLALLIPFAGIALGLVLGALSIVLVSIRRTKAEAHRHEQRMAMIEAGIHPDFPMEYGTSGEEAEVPKDTIAYKKKG